MALAKKNEYKLLSKRPYIFFLNLDFSMAEAMVRAKKATTEIVNTSRYCCDRGSGLIVNQNFRENRLFILN